MNPASPADPLARGPEARRLAALQGYVAADVSATPSLGLLTELAARVFGVRMACVTLIDEERIWLKASHGIGANIVPREPGLCSAALFADGVLHIPDTAEEPGLEANSVVSEGVRFYAGAALRAPDGQPVGTFCVMDTAPRELTDDERNTVLDFARLSMNEIERQRTVTDLELAKAAVLDGEERFRAIFEQAAVGIAQVGIDGRWLRVNRKLCEIVGYPQEELLELTFQDITHPEDLATNLEDLERTLAGEIDSYALEKRYLCKDGSTVWIHLAVSLVRGPDREPKYFISVIQDVGERRRAEEAVRSTEERLRHVQKLESLGVLAGGIAHDFNNLLVGVLGNAALLRTELAPDSPSHQAVGRIESSAQRAAELTNQMLAYSGKGKFVVGTIELNELVESTAELLRMGVEKSVLFRFSGASEPVHVEGDAAQLRQVLMNLVTNASDAIGESPGRVQVTVGTMEADRAYLASTYVDDGLPAATYGFFEVSDSGEGMDAETLARIFEPFFTTKFAGRGLGLAAVLGIVRGHRGAIHIASRKGHGSTFRVLFPGANVLPGPRATDSREHAVDWKGEGTVLVIEDEAAVRTFAEVVLGKAGFEVLSAADGVEGVRVFAENADRIVGILLDVTMPRKSGQTTFEEIRRLRADTPVVFTSGYDEESLPVGLARQPSVTFVKKPFAPRDLLARFRPARLSP